MNYIQEFISRNRKWLRASLVILGIGFVIGVIAFFIRPDLLDSILDMFTERFGTEPALDTHLALEIFKQNTIASAVALFGGIILGLAPTFIILVNGFLLGFIITSLVIRASEGILGSLMFIIAGILPHGIFELPAFLSAAALGLRLGVEWLRPSAKGQRWRTLGQNLVHSIRYFVAIVAVLFVAALIEVFVSGKLVEILGGT